MLSRMTKVIENLNVFPQNMERNIKLSHGGVFAQRVLTKMIEKGLSREAAYDLIQPLAMSASLGQSDFMASLEENEKVLEVISKEEIESLFEYSYYFRNVDKIYKRVHLL
jgi:adenylosuccinate lyase